MVTAMPFLTCEGGMVVLHRLHVTRPEDPSNRLMKRRSQKLRLIRTLFSFFPPELDRKISTASYSSVDRTPAPDPGLRSRIYQGVALSMLFPAFFGGLVLMDGWFSRRLVYDPEGTVREATMVITALFW